MSARAAYLREEAEKCRWHASKINDAETKAELLKLAGDYIERAAETERTRLLGESEA
jgi:hypothetical protein